MTEMLCYVRDLQIEASVCEICLNIAGLLGIPLIGPNWHVQ